MEIIKEKIEIDLGELHYVLEELNKIKNSISEIDFAEDLRNYIDEDIKEVNFLIEKKEGELKEVDADDYI